MPMDAEILDRMRLAAAAAAEKKAFHLVALDVTGLTAYTDGFLLCSTGSDRQVEAVVREIGRRFKKAGKRPLHVEGESRSEWVLIDFGDFVVHVFTEEKRAYYALDALWGDAPRITVGFDEPLEGQESDS
ncbi:MAG: ribosome silencing factor [bacterium]|nr:ribosome silencing factor [bacterium]